MSQWRDQCLIDSILMVSLVMSWERDDDDNVLFLECLTDKSRLALFPAGTIVRDSHKRKPLTRGEKDWNLCRKWIQTLLKEVV